eukprot:gene16430-48281_t
MKWGTIPVSMLIAVLLFGINNVGSEIEDPFGNDVNDFDLVKFHHPHHGVVCVVKFQMGLHKEMTTLTGVQARCMSVDDVLGDDRLWADV